MELLSNAVQNVYFYLGAAVCGIVIYLLSFYQRERKRTKRAAIIKNTEIIDELMELMHQGAYFNIETVFPSQKTKKKIETSRYRAWRSFAYWMAYKYAHFEYSSKTKAEILRLAALCFGEGSMSYSKLCALEEILNRSTKYYLGEESEHLRDLKPVEHPERLYDMVDMIVDSMYVNNY